MAGAGRGTGLPRRKQLAEVGLSAAAPSAVRPQAVSGAFGLCVELVCRLVLGAT